jgi:FAD/FMN-containing dehydrogenase
MDALIDALRAAVGAGHVHVGGDLSRFERDWRGRWQGRARAVVQPGCTAEVQAVVRACAAAAVPMVPQGGNTGLVGGSVPDDSGREVVVSLARLQRIVAVDADNLTLTAEAGCTLQTVQQAAAGAGLWFPLSLAAEGSCTIGGNLATNAGGTQVLRHGNARDLCLGLEVVTAAGEVWNGLGGLRKDNTGYDLKQLFIGSEGTLGLITAATLKLVPAPRAVLTALVACASIDDAVSVLVHARRELGDALTGCEAMNALSRRLVARHLPQLAQPGWDDVPWAVLLEAADAEGEAHARARFESMLETALHAGIARDAVVAASLAQAQALWHVREAVPLAQSREGLNIKHDIALPISQLARFVHATDAQLAQAFPGVRSVNFGHLGDGNLHYNVQAPDGVDAARFLADCEPAVNAIVYDAVAAHGGSISAEHGIGRLKRDELVRRKPPAALALMRALKRALDPDNLLNPGRLL